MATLQDILGTAWRDGMSIEDINNALAGVNLNANQQEIEKLKTAVSRANSEAAEFKRQLRDATTTATDADKAWQTKYQDLEKRFGALERERNIGAHKTRFLELGYDGTLAESTATAMVDNDLETVFKNHKAFLEAHDKKVLQDTLRQTPRPGSTQTGNAVVDYDKQIDEALASGDNARAAALMRMQSEANTKTS